MGMVTVCEGAYFFRSSGEHLMANWQEANLQRRCGKIN